jgi:spore coat protein A
MTNPRDFIITRREFLHKAGLISAAISAYPAYAMHSAPPTARVMDTSRLAQFVDALPIPKVLVPEEWRANPTNSKEKVPYFRLHMREAEATLHRDLKPTRFWGFDSSLPGPTIEAHNSQGLFVEWFNDLPKSHFLPIDHNLEGAERDKPEVRTVVHLHGGRVPPESDGYPEDWFVPGKSSLNFYPNNQDAATLWYHDHAMGINRLNMYAGLFGLYLIRDEFEEQLKLPAGEYEILSSLAQFESTMGP